jgi:hypothetical protein
VLLLVLLHELIINAQAKITLRVVSIYAEPLAGTLNIYIFPQSFFIFYNSHNKHYLVA